MRTTFIWIVALLAFTAIALLGCDLSGDKMNPVEPADSDDDSNDDDDCTDQDEDDWCHPQDCNDFDATIHPGASEDCFDLADNDCDFLTDLDDPDCAKFDK